MMKSFWLSCIDPDQVLAVVDFKEMAASIKYNMVINQRVNSIMHAEKVDDLVFLVSIGR